MKKYFLQTQIISLFLVLVLNTSCNGQVKTNNETKQVNEQTSTSTGQTKLIKNHFTNKYQEAADNVHCGLQDKAGNLWFGTTGDGVYRYDGKTFTNYTKKDGLDTNQILSILEDTKGNIWFGSRKGICKFDGKTISKIAINSTYSSNTFTSVYASTQNAVWSIMQDKNGIIWFGTDAGVYCYNGEIFTRFLDNPNIINPSGLKLFSVQSILQDSKGNIWFGSGPLAFEGICLYDGKQLTNYKPKNQQWIRKIVEGKNGIIYFASRQAGVLYYDPSAESTADIKFNSVPTPYTFINGSLTSMLEDHSGTIWMGSDYGNNPGDTMGGLWGSNSTTNNLAEKTFSKITNIEVFFMLEDKDHNLWLGTRGTGLYRYDRKTLTNFSE